ncbi:acyl-CoA dehydrogenase family protein [Alcaligenaceae bacterium]|nr:acyl-CoA dehydrogenase family protein [Alcaligenaceae bacterium]
MIGEQFFREEHFIFQRTARRFVEQELMPNREEWEALGTVPREVWLKAGASGLLCCDMPEEYGGAGGDYLHHVVLAQEMARAGGGAPAFSGHSETAAPYILNYGTAAQKAEWLPKAISGEAIIAIAMTEPHAGSDLQAIRTSARRDGDDYVIKGQKVYISNAQQAHLVIVACKTDPSQGAKGISLFLVETNQPGFVRGKMLKKIGRKAQDTLELFFDDVRVPASNLLGQEEGQGFYQLMGVLVQERLSSAIRSVSAMQIALDDTTNFVKEREAFGKPIAAFQNTQFELADLWSMYLAHKVFIEWCIGKHVEGKLTSIEAAAAKLRASECEGIVIDRSLQFFGGMGYMWETPIARAYADARVNRISAGSNHILKLLIGRELVK